jgi:hypothetical protein
MRVFSLPSPMDAGPSMTSTIGTASRPRTPTLAAIWACRMDIWLI